MRARVLFAVVLISCSVSRIALAQDAQYWTQKYGTSALLLNGTVLGSGVDLSTTFYNPGGLALMGDSVSVLAVKALDFSTVTIQDATGTGQDISEPRNSVLPTFFGGTVPIRFLGSVPLAYSFFPRQLAAFDLSVQSIRPIDLLPPAGAEPTALVARFEEDLSENWAGATWARKFGPKVGIGLSQYVAIRSQRVRREFLAQSFANDSVGGSFTDIRGNTYNDWRTITKVGIALELTKVHLGLNVTSPSIHIMGSGSAGEDRALVGFDENGDGTPDNDLIATYQDKIPVNYKSSLALGGGASVALGATTVYASAEHFDAVSRYSVFETSDAISVASGSPVSFKFYHEFEAVTNYGVGLQHNLSSRSVGYMSFSTDYSADPHGKSDFAIGDWDSYLATAGLDFPVGRSMFTVGLGYGWGSGDADRIGALDQEAADSGLLPAGTTFEDAKTRYSNFRVIFGFTI